jgi:hypothetical protein
MNNKIRHIVDAKDLRRKIAPDDVLLYRTSTWQVVEAPDDPSVLAIFARTTAGPTIGLEFPVSEAREIARQLTALTTAKSGGTH